MENKNESKAKELLVHNAHLQGHLHDVRYRGGFYDSTLLLLIIAIVGFVVQYSCNTLLARVYGPGMYGDISLGYNLLGLLVVVIPFGSYNAVIRFLAMYINTKKSVQSLSFLHWQRSLICDMGLILLGVTAIFFIFDLCSQHFFSYQTVVNQFLLAFFLLAPVASIFKILQSYVFIEGKVALSLFFSRIMLVAIQILIIVAIKAFGYPFDLLSLYVIIFSDYLIAILILIWVLKKTIFISPIAKSKQPAQTDPMWLKVSFNYLVGFIYSYGVNSVAFTLLKVMSRVNPVIASEHQLAKLGVCLTITAVFFLLPAMYNKVIPRLSSVVENNKVDEFNNQLKQISCQLLVLLLLVFFVVLIWGKAILAMFGSSYVSAYPVLMWLTMDGLFYAIFSFCYMSVPILGGSQMYSRLLRNTFFIFILLAALAIYFYSLYGLSILMFVIWIVPSLRIYFYIRKNTPIKPFGFF